MASSDPGRSTLAAGRDLDGKRWHFSRGEWRSLAGLAAWQQQQAA